MQRAPVLIVAALVLAPFTGCMDALRGGSDTVEWTPDFPSHLEVRIKGRTHYVGDVVDASFYLVNDNDTRKFVMPAAEEYQIFLFSTEGSYDLLWTELGHAYGEHTVVIPHGRVEIGAVNFDLVDMDGEWLPPGQYELKVKFYGHYGGARFTVTQ